MRACASSSPIARPSIPRASAWSWPRALQQLYPGKIDFALSRRLIGSDDVIHRLQAGEDPRLVEQSYQDALAAFDQLRQQYLLYK